MGSQIFFIYLTLSNISKHMSMEADMKQYLSSLKADIKEIYKLQNKPLFLLIILFWKILLFKICYLC